jgi:flagellar hook-associated protein 2
MANTSVDGLISGLSTSDVITQLLQLERQPQTRLQAQRKALDTTTAAYQNLNTRFDGILQSAKALDAAADWQAMAATTSDSSRLTASASASALAASLSVSVERLATAHTVVSEVAVAGLDTVVAAGAITFTVAGVPQAPIATGDGKLSSVVTAINAANAGVTAAAVQVAPGQYRLQLTASSTGANAAFTVDPTSLAALADPGEPGPDPEAFNLVVAGADAEIKIGGASGYSVTSATNTFADLLPGVSLTAVKADPGVLVTVGIKPDADALVAKVDKLVTAVNSALKLIADSSTYDPKTGSKGVLLGNGLARQLQQNLYSALGVDLAGSSLGDLGMKLGANGLELDKAKLLAAYAADPAKVIDSFTGESTGATTDGLATKLANLGKLATDASTGLVSMAIKSTGDKAATFDKQIAAWDVRLATRESTLRRQYAAMETALGTLKNQSSWLAGQISGLPKWE